MKKRLLLAILFAAVSAEAVRARRANGGVFNYDFTNNVPSTVSCNRASGTVWPMTGSNTTSQNTSGSTCVFENRTGAANDGGIWTWPAWSNPLSTPNDLVTGWTVSGSGARTNNAVTSPDGTANAAKIDKNQTSTFFADTRNITQAQPIALTFWYKNDTTPGAHGMNYWNGTGAVDPGCKDISAPPPSSWTRGMWWIGSMANTSNATLSPLAFAPAGLACGPTFTNTASGALDYWGVQLATQIDYPLGAGSIAAQTLNFNSGELGRIVIGGDIELDVFARTWIQELRAQPNGCLIGGQHSVSNAEFSLCYTANTNSATAATWTLKVEGVTVLTTQMGLPLYGGELRARISCRPSSNKSVLRISINGATEYSKIATGTCNASVPLNTLSSLYLGSNNGTTSYWPAQFTKVISYVRPQAYDRDEILWMGDSISSWTFDTDAIGARLDNVVITAGAGGSFSDVGSSAAGTLGTQSGGGIYTLAQSRNLQAHPGIAAYVTPGATCESICSGAAATPYWGSGFTHIILLQCLTNNINTGQNEVTAIGHYQNDCVTPIKAANPNAPLVCVQITPWGAHSAEVNALNADIAGTGAHNVTGCDYVVTHANTALDDGAGNCLYCTDNIHPNNKGRQIMTGGTGAGTYVGALTNFGILP